MHLASFGKWGFLVTTFTANFNDVLSLVQYGIHQLLLWTVFVYFFLFVAARMRYKELGCFGKPSSTWYIIAQNNNDKPDAVTPEVSITLFLMKILQGVTLRIPYIGYPLCCTAIIQ